MAIFKDLDCCVEPVLSLREALLEDEHIRARNLVVEVEVPCSGGRTVKQLGSPMNCQMPSHLRKGGYPLGYHTREVIQELGLDYDALQRKAYSIDNNQQQNRQTQLCLPVLIVYAAVKLQRQVIRLTNSTGDFAHFSGITDAVNRDRTVL